MATGRVPKETSRAKPLCQMKNEGKEKELERKKEEKVNHHQRKNEGKEKEIGRKKAEKLNRRTQPLLERKKGEKVNRHAQPLDQSKNEGKEKESSHDDLQSPNWKDLPSDLLQLILDHISSSIPCLLSFSAVCTSWRSLAKSSINSVSPPPLILSSSLDNGSRQKKRSSMSQLRTLTANLSSRTFRSPISKNSLNRKCCGYSHGHLIFAASSDCSVLIADVFSSAEFHLPSPPRGGGFSRITHGVLTAPPSSPSCMLFLIGSCDVLCQSLEGDKPKDRIIFRLGSDQRVSSVIVFNGKLHVLHVDGAIFVLEFDPLMHWKRLPDSPRMGGVSLARFANCDGQLLLVLLWRRKTHRANSSGKTGPYMTNSIQLYWMDRDEGEWARVENIGDWCLFMDYVGGSPLACQNPEKWGGESNCVYFVGLESKGWSVLPLDGTEYMSAIFLVNESDFWPCPAWVYPSMLL